MTDPTLDGPADAQPPTWEDAFANAEVLQEQGVNVRVHDGQKWILICDDNGDLHDPDDGTPAFQRFYPDGSPEWISRWTAGSLASEERFPPSTGVA